MSKDTKFIVKIKDSKQRYLVKAESSLKAKEHIINVFRGRGQEIEVLTVTIKHE